jgi:hypothetical protein
MAKYKVQVQGVVRQSSLADVMRRTYSYAAVTTGLAQRRNRTFYEAIKNDTREI